MDIDHPLLRHVYVGMAAVAGAVTSLSVMRWQTMPKADIWMTIFVGSMFAIFVVPWAATSFLNLQYDNLRTVCGLTYLGGTAANALIPPTIRKIKKIVGLEEGNGL